MVVVTIAVEVVLVVVVERKVVVVVCKYGESSRRHTPGEDVTVGG